MANFNGALFCLYEGNILPKFSGRLPWQGEFATYAVDMAKKDKMLMIQQYSGNLNRCVYISVRFHFRGHEGEFALYALPGTFLPLVRDIIRRIGVPVSVNFRGELDLDFRPEVDVTALLRGLRIEYLSVVHKTLVVTPPPRNSPACPRWKFHPLRTLKVAGCESTKEGWDSLCRIVRECPLREFYILKQSGAPATAVNFCPQQLMHAWARCSTLTHLEIMVDETRVPKTHFNPGRLIEMTATFPHLATLRIQSQDAPLGPHGAAEICTALALPRRRALDDLGLKLALSDASLASIIDAIRASDNVANLFVARVHPAHQTAGAFARLALRNGRMYRFNCNILFYAHWARCVAVVAALLQSTHMPQIIEGWDSRNPVEAAYVRMVRWAHLWRNPAYYKGVEAHSFHSCARYANAEIFPYSICYLIHNVESGALASIFEGMPTGTDAVTVGSTAVTWNHLGALARARPLLRALAIMRCEVAM